MLRFAGNRIQSSRRRPVGRRRRIGRPQANRVGVANGLVLTVRRRFLRLGQPAAECIVGMGPVPGQLLLESKQDMRKRGVSSPDEADAVALCFSEPDGAPFVKNKDFYRDLHEQ
jgi:hypothetical protein